MAELQRSIADDGRKAWALTAIADTLAENGQPEPAIEIIEQAIAAAGL
ncbi:MAG: hypothetical protein WBB29_10525 [Geitlerinemataceae cyanobacterium]